MKNLFDINYFDLASRSLEEIKGWFSVKEEGHSKESANQVRDKYGDNEIDYGTENPYGKLLLMLILHPLP